MYSVTIQVHFCYGHRLLHYEGKCRHLHGHNARAEITLTGPALDSRGMLYDFVEIRHLIKDWIDETIDHTMLLNQADPVLDCLKQGGERVHGMEDNPTAENIARMIYGFVHKQGYPVHDVAVWETETSCARYAP